jgi:hypothetical protein
MANSGRDSNKSQFFITYAKQPHLDGNNTIFGKVIDGLDTLEAMERVPVNNKNRPLQEIKLDHVCFYSLVVVFSSSCAKPGNHPREPNRRRGYCRTAMMVYPHERYSLLLHSS